MAPADSKTTTKFVSSTNANSLKAAIFHTMTFFLSLEINTDQVTTPTKRSFLKVLYIVCKIKKKHVFLTIGPKPQSAEPLRTLLSFLNSSFTSKDECFHMAIQETCDAFNQALVYFGYNQILEKYDPKIHQLNPPQQHPFY